MLTRTADLKAARGLGEQAVAQSEGWREEEGVEVGVCLWQGKEELAWLSTESAVICVHTVPSVWHPGSGKFINWWGLSQPPKETWLTSAPLPLSLSFSPPTLPSSLPSSISLSLCFSTAPSLSLSKQLQSIADRYYTVESSPEDGDWLSPQKILHKPQFPSSLSLSLSLSTATVHSGQEPPSGEFRRRGPTQSPEDPPAAGYGARGKLHRPWQPCEPWAVHLHPCYGAAVQEHAHK